MSKKTTPCERLQQSKLYKNANLDSIYKDEEQIDAEYQGKQVTLNKPFRTEGESKKFAVYVKNKSGNVVKVRFGDPDMEIKRDDPKAREAFRARHNCKEKTDKTKAGYWSCKFWSSKSVSELLDNTSIYGMKDKSITFDMNTISIDEVTGFLTVDAVIARTGIQDYLGFEVGEDNEDIVGVYRSEEEVTHPNSLKTFTNVAVTDEHPDELVTIDNYSNYAKGSISDVFVVQLSGEKALKTKLTVTDKELISSIKEGKKELSVGYTNVLVEQEGVYKDKPYKYLQTDIVANHVAVVDAGRCGSVCKLMTDNQLNQSEGNSMKITINGVEYEVPEEVANEFAKLKEASEGMEDMEKEKGSMEEEIKTSKDTIEQLTAQLDAAKSSTNDKQVNKLVGEKMNLLSFAKDAKVEGVKPEQTTKVMKAMIVDSLGGTSDGKGEAYLDAFIDVKRAELKDGKEAFKKQMDDAGNHKPENGNADVSEHESKEI